MTDISLSRSALVAVIDQLYPGPDDVDPWGPFGPVVADRRWAYWVLAGLNPQPLPPRKMPPREKWGKIADPWHARVIAGAVLHRVSELAVLSESVGGSERSVEIGTSWIRRFVDDWCGNEPIVGPFGPIPDPWRPVPVEDVHPVNLVVAGAQFHKAAEAKSIRTLHDAVVDAADRLLDTGLSQLADLNKLVR